ncbi:MAG TPA: four helix bundle protein [Gemmatimonadaceae bacterium]|nr:four helix bundle protein [Gemmatimonadaceae bacterium]
MADYRKLQVWKKAYALALNADRVATEIRNAAHKPLRSQLNRAALSIPTNIVEGRAKTTDKDFARFLGYAMGSATELEHHVMIGRDLGAISATDAKSLLAQTIEVRKMLQGLINRLNGE